MNEDIGYAVPGWRYTLVIISVVKRYLTSEIPTDYRLKFLEWLDREAIEWGTETIAAISPICDAAYEIVVEARKLGWQKAFDTFAQQEVFSAFVAKNPSLLAAIRARSGRPQKWSA